jgi:hypothetical protein
MKWPCQQIDPALPPGRDWPIGCQRQNTPICTASSAGGRHPITAPNDQLPDSSAWPPLGRSGWLSPELNPAEESDIRDASGADRPQRTQPDTPTISRVRKFTLPRRVGGFTVARWLQVGVGGALLFKDLDVVSVRPLTALSVVGRVTCTVWVVPHKRLRLDRAAPEA